MKAKLGIAPIAWWNDDLAELSDDVSLEECLRQASVAGFTGMETGRRFPLDPGELARDVARLGAACDPLVDEPLELVDRLGQGVGDRGAQSGVERHGVLVSSGRVS